MKRSIILVFLLVTQATAQSQSIDSAQTDGLAIAPLAHRSAEAWGLSIEEWQRQTELRALEPGHTFSRFDAARSAWDTDRQSRPTADGMRGSMPRSKGTLLDRIAAFEADYLEEYAALNQRLSAGLNDRSTLVIDIDCVSTKCRRQVAEALAIAQKGAVDVYVVGSAGNDAAVSKMGSDEPHPTESGAPASDNAQSCQTGHETRAAPVIAHPSPLLRPPVELTAAVVFHRSGHSFYHIPTTVELIVDPGHRAQCDMRHVGKSQDFSEHYACGVTVDCSQTANRT